MNTSTKTALAIVSVLLLASVAFVPTAEASTGAELPEPVVYGSEDDPDSGYRSRIDKKSECAEVGKYSVFMTDTKIKAEVSATRRASIQAYTFPKRDDARILVDLFAPSEYLHNLQDVQVKKISDTEIEGYATYFGAYTGYIGYYICPA